MHLDQNVHAKLECRLLKPLCIGVAEARHDQQNGVRAPQPGFVNLIRLEHEVLAQRRERDRGACRGKEFGCTLKGWCVGKHGKACGAALGIGLSQRRRVEVVTDQPFRRASFLDLRD
jgi:hypothetical protein